MVTFLPVCSLDKGFSSPRAQSPTHVPRLHSEGGSGSCAGHPRESRKRLPLAHSAAPRAAGAAECACAALARNSLQLRLLCGSLSMWESFRFIYTLFP